MSHLPNDRIKKEEDTRRGSRGGDEVKRMHDMETAFADKSENPEGAFLDEFTIEVLPKVPERPGFHRVWLSLTNTNDPIHRRIRVGYRPVRAEDVPGYETLRMKSGEHEGCVCMNEMLLFEISVEKYQCIMTELHWNAPLEEIEKLKNSRKSHERDSRGVPVIKDISEDIYDDKPRRPPIFEG